MYDIYDIYIIYAIYTNQDLSTIFPTEEIKVTIKLFLI